MGNVHKGIPTQKQDELEYNRNTCDYKSHNIESMKRHVKLHDRTIICKRILM